MAALGSNERPLRVAVVGSGPSGFYAAEALLNSDLHVQVDMFERLPCPYGLVRFGVAPDHAKLKNVTRVFDKIAGNDDFAFFGNVTIGSDITIDELLTFADAIILANGAQTDRRLNIPGEDLPGSHTATEFVAWYNGHPDYRGHVFDFSQETVAVFGQGNVAVDVCRVLAKTTDELKTTDIAKHALEALAESKIKTIHMIGRRGPVQAKFAQKEIKELGQLEDCNTTVDPEDLSFDPLSQADYDDPGNTTARKNVPILQGFSKGGDSTKSRRLRIQFLKSPVEILGNQRVEKVILERNELVGEPLKLKAQGTGERNELPCGLIFRSVGYRGVAMPGVPFHEAWGSIPNEQGRVTEDGKPLPGLYTSGWIKRGPSGLIGTNKPDSQETVAALIADVNNLEPCDKPNREAVGQLLKARNIRFISFDNWRIIDQAEIARGAKEGKPREKFTSPEEMLAVIDSE